MSSIQPNRGDKRRIQILQATVDAIAGEKLEAITLESIARKCKVRRSHIAYYFSDPQKLIRSAIEYALSFGQEYAVHEISLATTAEDRLRAFVYANFHWFESYPKHAAVFGLLNYYSVCNGDYAKLNSDLAEMAEARLEAILAGGAVSDSAKKSKDLRAVARTLRAFLVGSLARYFSSTARRPLEIEKKYVLEEFLKIARRAWQS